MQCVKHGIDDGGRRAYGPRLAAALGAQRVVGAGRDRVVDGEAGQVIGRVGGVPETQLGAMLALAGVWVWFTFFR